MKYNNNEGWHQLLNDYPLHNHYKEIHIYAYSEFMPSPKVGLSPYGDIDYLTFSDDDEFGWKISEMEEEMELKPGMNDIGKILLKQIHNLGMGLPAHHISGHANQSLINNPYWPEELSVKAGKLKNEKYVCLLPLMLSKTQDDKGRVTWTYFGSSILGPEKAFWNSFYTTPEKEIPESESLEFFTELLKKAYNNNSSLSQAGFKILPTKTNEILPEFTKPFLINDDSNFNEVKYLLTFRPFSLLPQTVKEQYFSDSGSDND